MVKWSWASVKGPWGVIKANDDVNIWSVEIEDEKVTAANVDLDNLPPDTDIAVGLYMPCGLEVDWWPIPGLLHFEWYAPIDEDHHLYTIRHAKVVNSPAVSAMAFFRLLSCCCPVDNRTMVVKKLILLVNEEASRFRLNQLNGTCII